MLPSLPGTGGLVGGLPALNELTSYAYLLSHIPGVPDTATPLAPLAPLAAGLPLSGLPVYNGLPIPTDLLQLPSGLPVLGVGDPLGFPPPALDDLMSAGSPLMPLANFLAPAQPTPAFAPLEGIAGFLII